MIKLITTKDGTRYLKKPVSSRFQCDICCFYKRRKCTCPPISEVGLCFSLGISPRGTGYFYYEKVKFKENRLKLL